MNTKNPYISVVIPAFNEEKYLPQCLKALQNQTFKDFEIIVVDNNSTDETAEIAKKADTKVVEEKRQGTTFAQEKGFSSARGSIIARTDADTIVSPNWLSLIAKTFRENPDVVALTGSFDSPYKTFPNLLFHLATLIFVSFTQILTGHPALHGPNMAVRKDAWKKVKIHNYDSLVHEDIDLACHLSKIGKILFLPHLKTTYSLRRIKKPVSLFVEYPIRYFKTIFLHHPGLKRHKILI
ncbi:glycosyltransferase family 2 protein [Candidatus Gottesmanbacteria bacterium]|nr:glycosyltransferase family 2 protein [Candidatus Gottesmanbacteria bacterium]